jgi:hypothetical protein
MKTTATLLLLLLASCTTLASPAHVTAPMNTPRPTVVNAFIDIVQKRYEGRDGGELSPPVMGTTKTMIDFQYDRMGPGGQTGERIELFEGLASAPFERVGMPRLGYKVKATYEMNGPNAKIEGLAKKIADELSARLASPQSLEAEG